MKELKLAKPVMAHGEQLHVLEFREPTYDEIEAIGFPFTVNDGGNVRPDSGAALKYIPLLANIPRSSAANLAKFDIFKASMIILTFFTGSGAETTSENASTIPPTSGE